LDYLTLEDGIDRLYQNVGKELPLYAAWYLRRAHISHDNMAMHTMVWLGMVWLSAVQCSAVQHFIHEFKMTSYFSTTFKEKN
jgi:hypothetical protein